MHRTEISFDCNFLHPQSLFFKLLYDESSKEVQVSCVGIIRRILIHRNTDILLKTRSEWTKCIEFLLLNRKKAVREAFCTQKNSFLGIEDLILHCLFCDEEKPTKIKEHFWTLLNMPYQLLKIPRSLILFWNLQLKLWLQLISTVNFSCFLFSCWSTSLIIHIWQWEWMNQG